MILGPYCIQLDHRSVHSSKVGYALAVVVNDCAILTGRPAGEGMTFVFKSVRVQVLCSAVGKGLIRSRTGSAFSVGVEVYCVSIGPCPLVCVFFTIISYCSSVDGLAKILAGSGF